MYVCRTLISYPGVLFSSKPNHTTVLSTMVHSPTYIRIYGFISCVMCDISQVCLKKTSFEWGLGSGDGALHYEDGELSLTYYNGHTCPTNYLTASTTFNFVCSQHNTTGPRYLEDQDCSYFFEWETPLACSSVASHTGSCKDVTFGESRFFEDEFISVEYNYSLISYLK